MAISFDTDQLVTSVRTLQKVAASGGNVLAHFKVVNSDTVQLSAINKGIGISLNVSARVGKEDKNKTFSVEPGALLALISGRKDVSLLINSSTVLVKASGYEAELVTSTVEIEDILPSDLKTSDKTKVGQDVVEFIAQSLPGLELKPMLNIDSFMPVAVRVTAKGAKMICYDNWHLAYTSNSKVTGELDLVVPYSALSLLTKEFGGMSFYMIATESSLYAYNKVFQLALTLPHQENQNKISPDDAFALVAKLKSSETVSLDLSSEDLRAVALNIEAIFKKGEYVDFDVDKASGCTVTLKSTHGKVQSTLRCKPTKSVAFRTGFAFLKDALSKLPENKVTFQVVGEQMLFFTKGRFMYMLALLSRDEKKPAKAKKAKAE